MESNNEIIRQKLKKTITKENIRLMEINIEYPSIKALPDEKIKERINNFYRRIAESYAAFCERSAERINIREFTSSFSKHMGGTMKYMVSLNSYEYLSIVCECSFYDGYFKRKSRISQTWRLSDGIMLPHTYFLKREGLNHKMLKRKIGDIVTEKIREDVNDFTYTDKSYKKYAYNIDPKNYFLCTNGLAFWFQPGTLAPVSEGFPTFVVPFKKEKSHRDGSS